MEIIQTDDFERSLNKLPKEIQRLYFTQKSSFQKNWCDPRLHIKKVKILPHALSFRVTRNYRVLFYFQHAETAIFFDIDHRKDIYR